MTRKPFARIASKASLVAAVLAIALPATAADLSGRNDARGPGAPSLAAPVETAAASAGRNATPRKAVILRETELADACIEPNGRNLARTGIVFTCDDVDRDGAPES